MNWQPISTAPTDGAEYLAWGESAGFFVFNQPSKHHKIGRWSIVDGDWRGCAGFFGDAMTHWTPIDGAPA